MPSRRCVAWEPNAGPDPGALRVQAAAPGVRGWIRRGGVSLVDALQGVLDLAGEPRCVSCQGFAAGVLCHACQERCEPVPGPTCPRCGSAPTEGAPDAACGRCQRFGRAFAFERALAVWSYAGPVRRAVLAFKFGGRPDAARQLGRAMANWPTLGAWLVGLPDALVVPVPARRAARRWRGYDQAALLARGLAGAAGRACDGRALARRREQIGRAHV